MTSSRRVVVTGRTGQLAQAVVRHAPRGAHITTIGRPELDLTDWKAIRDAMVSLRPDVVIHAAAATNVDACETDPVYAFAVNAGITRNVARAAAHAGAVLVYVSTNYVFDGIKPEPYHEWDAPAPISVYGASKLAGEHEAQAASDRCFIARTAWLYSASGNNFVQTMQRLMGERPDLNVVADQFGNPTYASDLAVALYTLVDHAPFGTYHLVNSGLTTWFDWAVAIRDRIGAECRIHPIPGSEYKRAANPPVNGGMVSLASVAAEITLPDWSDALARCLST